MSNLSDDDEAWIRECEQAAWARPRAPRQSFPPIHVGNVRRRCGSCGEEAAVELFSDGKCLACQAADYLGPLR